MSVRITPFDSWYFVLISNSVTEIDGLEKLLVHFAISMWNQIESCGVFSCDFNGRVSAWMNFIPFVSIRSRFYLSIVDVLNLRYKFNCSSTTGVC